MRLPLTRTWLLLQRGSTDFGRPCLVVFLFADSSEDRHKFRRTAAGRTSGRRKVSRDIGFVCGLLSLRLRPTLTHGPSGWIAQPRSIQEVLKSCSDLAFSAKVLVLARFCPRGESSPLFLAAPSSFFGDLELFSCVVNEIRPVAHLVHNRGLLPRSGITDNRTLKNLGLPC